MDWGCLHVCFKNICQKHFLVSLFWLQIKNSSINYVHCHQHSSYTRFYNFQLSLGEFFFSLFINLHRYYEITNAYKYKWHCKKLSNKTMIQHTVAYLDKLIVGYHCVKSVQIRSVFWSVFSPNAGKYGPGKTPYLYTLWYKVIHKIMLMYILTESLKQ